MLVSDFEFELPGELIADTPVRPRDASRLLAYDVCDILVEGGAVLHRSIWAAGVVDRVRLYVAPVTLGPGAVPWMPDGEISMAALGGGESQSLGDDVLLEADVQRVD